LVEVLAGAGIGFLGRYNALYEQDEFTAMLAEMCESGRMGGSVVPPGFAIRNPEGRTARL